MYSFLYIHTYISVSICILETCNSNLTTKGSFYFFLFLYWWFSFMTVRNLAPVSFTYWHQYSCMPSPTAVTTLYFVAWTLSSLYSGLYPQSPLTQYGLRTLIWALWLLPLGMDAYLAPKEKRRRKKRNKRINVWILLGSLRINTINSYSSIWGWFSCPMSFSFSHSLNDRVSKAHITRSILLWMNSSLYT